MRVLAEADLRLDAGPIDYALLVLDFAVVLGIGVMAPRSVSTSLDFLLSGRDGQRRAGKYGEIRYNRHSCDVLGHAFLDTDLYRCHAAHPPHVRLAAAAARRPRSTAHTPAGGLGR